MSNLFSSSILSIATAFNPDAQIVLHEGDCRTLLTNVPDNSIKLLITSPPYNLGKSYEKKQAIEQYLAEQADLIKEFYRILHPQGSLCWQVGNYVDSGEVFPLDIYYYPLFKQAGLFLRNRIIWHFGHGLHASKRFSGRYETLLWFTKTDTYTFNLDAVRVPSKYPGKRHYKGPNKGKPSGNPKGKNPSDIWTILADDWTECVWDIPNVKSNHPEKTIHPCQFPVELVERCLLALTDEDDWVLDPYAGVGSSLIAAIKNKRRAVGAEKEAAYLEIARQRLHDLENGVLKTRPMHKPVHVPSGREKVSQRPDEWEQEQIKLLEEPGDYR
jgi:adenine-specific DNA-methyltransferase